MDGRARLGLTKRTWCAAVGLLLLAACSTARRPLPQFDPTQLPSTTTVRVFDPAGKPETDPVVVGPSTQRVGKLRTNPWSDMPQDPASDRTQQEPQPPPPKQDAPAEAVAAEDLYSRFGPRIIIHPDQRVTKIYYVDADTGRVLDSLLSLAGGEAETGAQGQPPAGQKPPSVHRIGRQGRKEASILDTLLASHEIIVQRVAGFDSVKAVPMDPREFKGFVASQPNVVTNDLVLVTATPEGLEAFEQALDLFYRSVPQIIIEAKVVEIASGDTLDFGVRPVDAKTPTVSTVNPGSFIKSILSVFPNSTFASQGEGSTVSEGLLTIGGIHDNIQLNAVLELLQTRLKADIVSNPRIAVRNGGVAVIETTTQVPYPEAKIVGNNTQSNIKFIKVGVAMQIYPVVQPGDTVSLQIHASVDAITGFASTDPIPTPEVSTRKAVTSVCVPSGKTTVIGGLITRNRFESESMIPLLGDIPVVGWLFRSTNIQTSENEVLFFIRPRIVYGFEGEDSEESWR